MEEQGSSKLGGGEVRIQEYNRRLEKIFMLAANLETQSLWKKKEAEDKN